MIKQCLSILIFMGIFVSCKKKASDPEDLMSSNSGIFSNAAMPLAVGNYWVYQKSLDDSIGTYRMQNEFDSVYIQKDTSIAGETYYKLVHTNPQGFQWYYGYYQDYIWIKDSVGYLKNLNTKLILDTVHLADTVMTINTGGGFYNKIVPDKFYNMNFYLGTYSGYWMKSYIIYPAGMGYYNGVYCYQAFANNIGLMRARMLFAAAPYLTMYSYHLIRYHLN